MKRVSYLFILLLILSVISLSVGASNFSIIFRVDGNFPPTLKIIEPIN